MGLSGRKRRLASFTKRAESFVSEYRGKRSRFVTEELFLSSRYPKATMVGITRSRRTITAGRKQNKGLVLKREDLKDALATQERLVGYLKANKIPLENFVFVKVHGETIRGLDVQEHFHVPNMEQLLHYHALKGLWKLINEKPSIIELPRAEYFLCKRFLNQKQNKRITPELTEKAYNEFRKHLAKIWRESTEGRYKFSPTNVLVHGITKEGKLRISLIDL